MNYAGEDGEMINLQPVCQWKFPLPENNKKTFGIGHC